MDDPYPKVSNPAETTRRGIGRACENASKVVDELRETMEGLAGVGLMQGTETATGGPMSAKTVRALAPRLRSDARLRNSGVSCRRIS